jgi:hypothetical protein
MTIKSLNESMLLKARRWTSTLADAAVMDAITTHRLSTTSRVQQFIRALQTDPHEARLFAFTYEELAGATDETLAKLNIVPLRRGKQWDIPIRLVVVFPKGSVPSDFGLNPTSDRVIVSIDPDDQGDRPKRNLIERIKSAWQGAGPQIPTSDMSRSVVYPQVVSDDGVAGPVTIREVYK